MSDQQRVQLDTKIEREVHRLVQFISEGVYDRLNIYVRRNDIQIDPDVFNALLATVRATITELEMNNIDGFHQAIKTELDAYVGDESPATPKPTESTSKKREAKPVRISV